MDKCIMVGYRKYRTKAKRTLRKKSSKKPKAKGVSTAVAKYVNRVVHRNIENKSIQYRNQFDFDNVNASAILHVQPVAPCNTVLSIPQGSGAGERLGNSISTRKLTIKYILYPNKQDQSVNPMPRPKEVLIWFGFVKGERKTTPILADMNQLFQDGNTSTPAYGNLWDCLLPVNKDLFTVCKQVRHKLSTQYIYDWDGHGAEFSFYANNDFKYNVGRTIDLTKYINKKIKFDDATTYTDTGLYMWVEAVNADGTTETNATRSIGMSYVLDYEYEDA